MAQSLDENPGKLDPIDGPPIVRDRFAKAFSLGLVHPEEINKNYLTTSLHLAPSSVNDLIESAKAKAKTLRGGTEAKQRSEEVDVEDIPRVGGRFSGVAERLDALRSKSIIPTVLLVVIGSIGGALNQFGLLNAVGEFILVCIGAALFLLQVFIVHRRLKDEEPVESVGEAIPLA